MTSCTSHTSVDCSDAYALSEWWKQVLGYVASTVTRTSRVTRSA